MLGTSIDLLVGNAAGVPAPGSPLFGAAQSSLPTGFGGLLLTVPGFSMAMNLPSGGATIPLFVPNDPFLCGGILYLQAVHIDAGASHGIAFTPGLELVGGN